ncbi:hypothetical protein A2276_07625 [candidate division WOR-1 bacterium RIFOXYA12_FULL_43_27]|uniref:GyrI-like small molecule binding domain-containing protein n=1 Tax=candidate division WOR-1 bacterium RIFOXYC2_FULL_46_14 TaxID=1802587 RepID=A0A1F4U5V1_UNCSA|nr:MAG: hypothetical protein A2276_07625 [candidate division WOR-1 bacterium RIFOXYA12_FULL_43_27]OGC20471.1 MAG: hypothetical protein A2292_05450 [candidate division WOR-1 bacterium RIFOXYB2_FULL_46_45]OGC31792.1 MAG: hypothetical protein A2232_06000 [candidate division WOR-1 bacterium RIFOXYA2_FULL_46_56]OGC40316.1 MAG: hypothetical protein A2438_03470 [candidate division WOR-1 bacterium RIFOXYC2_FULL_46_14]
MKILKVLFWIIVVLVVAVAGFLWYLGFFGAVQVTEAKNGPYVVVYEEFTGPYSQTGPIFDKLGKALKNDAIKSTKGLGIYYDNPAVVAQEKLRSTIGIAIETKDLQTLKKLKGKYKIKFVKEGNYITAEFPLKNMISYIIGPGKVYPEMMKHMQAKGYKPVPGIEVYDMTGGKIIYLMEIVK